MAAKDTDAVNPAENDPSAANPITRKLHKILESKVETDKETLEALRHLSEFYNENSLSSRRNLRRDIEKRSLQINRSFLESFRAVKEELDKLNSTITLMSQSCQDMTDRLQKTKEQTRDLLNQTTRLQNESKTVEKRAVIANAFIAKFSLNPQEEFALKGNPDGSIGPEFFSALTKCRQIHLDCKLLLSVGQTCGLEIMDHMSKLQESAFELLYRWIQRECRLLNSDNVDLNPLLPQAFKAMEDRPVLFKYSLDEYIMARRNNIVRSFIDALTRGGPSGVPKPIELLSHDPLRYVGDMYAWIHQALMNEKDLLIALFKQCAAEETNSLRIPHGLAQITEGLCRPLKVRVEQVLNADNGPVTLYKLSILSLFYQNTVKNTFGENGQLFQTLLELKELTSNLFFSSLSSHVHRLLERIQPPGSDLLPVQGVHQLLLLLRDVLESHDTTLVPVDSKQENYAKIFNNILDPMLQSLHLTATHLDACDLAVYMLNCLHVIKNMLALYEYTDRRLEMLQAQMDAQCDVLVSEQAGYILQRTGMSQLYNNVLQHKVEQGPLAKVRGAEGESIKAALDRFDLFLSSPDSYKISQNKLISSLKVKESIHLRTLEVICTAYGQIYKKIHDPANAYENAAVIMPKTAEDLAKLLL